MLALENLALRHQIGVLQRSATKRCHVTSADRLLWVWLSRLWSDWRSALAIVWLANCYFAHNSLGSRRPAASDRILAGLMALMVRPARLLRSAIVLTPSTLLGLHKVLSKQKYRLLLSTNHRRKPGPKGPSAELIRAVVEMKPRNPNWGCPRIAQQIALALHIQINKDVVRRVLAQHRSPGKNSGGPSWLTFLGHMKDSLWSMDLFRCEVRR